MRVTDPKIFRKVVGFAKAVGMVALPVYKEQPGYIFKSLLDAAMALYVNGVADLHTVDKIWMIATGAPKGPFAIYDVFGLTIAYNINQ